MIIQEANGVRIKLHRRHDPETSKQAAESVVDKRGRLQAIVLFYAANQARKALRTRCCPTGSSAGAAPTAHAEQS